MFLSFTWDGLIANDHSFLTEVKEEKFLLNNLHSIPFIFLLQIIYNSLRNRFVLADI